ncbi:hypothetical protein J5X98_01155 [Leptothermofonsia sichuanensis E412]|uniref:hypothetical protein n=1 Tax=Leptothermofonsia sichuanensis TaxID=2917832 RepID=UPI001CA6F644|nr:hypothetical protein [Leptothermofonsia sichuanensis]QZZ21145.1 hypothetical protein J5X98_01155 [Leptothermofonsia sichuanensis E412]
MDILWSRFLRALYRKEPIVGFVATVGVVDAAIGGLTEHWLLLTLGFGTVGGAIALRLWQLQRRQAIEQIHQNPVHLLPPQSSRPSLPTLTTGKKNPPGRGNR